MLNIVNQLFFARYEFRKGFSGVTDEEGLKRLMPINSIAWMVGHLAWHEQFYWLKRAQNIVLIPELEKDASFRKPSGELFLCEMIVCWEEVTEKADGFLKLLSLPDLDSCMVVKDKKLNFNIGTMLSRMIYHYWYHNGEMQAVRQLIGHEDLPDFVSDDIETIGKYYTDE
jgi:hypothetical protein